MTDTEDEFERPSKSQKKREMAAFREMAERLVALSHEQLSSLPMPAVIESAEQAKRITKGNARKRQVQHLTKLLSKSDIEPVQLLLDTLDASTAAHVQKFHQLEQWREQLIADDADVMQEIISEHPDVDRQQLRHLVRSAVKEQQTREDRVEYRKLFQFLKSLSD